VRAAKASICAVSSPLGGTRFAAKDPVRQGAQSLQLGRLAREPRGRRAADLDGFRGYQGQESRHRDPDPAHEHEDGDDARQRRSPSQPLGKPLVERRSQPRDDGREEDRHDEVADDHEKEHRDPRHQQEEEGPAKAESSGVEAPEGHGSFERLPR
jgi:hypothetical protein